MEEDLGKASKVSIRWELVVSSSGNNDVRTAPSTKQREDVLSYQKKTIDSVMILYFGNLDAPHVRGRGKYENRVSRNHEQWCNFYLHGTCCCTGVPFCGNEHRNG